MVQKVLYESRKSIYEGGYLRNVLRGGSTKCGNPVLNLEKKVTDLFLISCNFLSFQ